MNVLFRYLTRQVLSTILGITLVLLVVFISNTFVHYLRYAAIGHFTAESVLKLMAIQVPVLLCFLLPLALYLGILLVYGQLYADNEMTVLYACGVSKLRLLRMTLAYASVVMLVVTILTLFIEPDMVWYQQRIIAQAIAASPLQKLPPGRFVNIGDKFVFYAQGVSNDHKKMKHLFVAQYPKGVKGDWNIVSAQTAEQWKDPKTNQLYIVLKHGSSYQGIPGMKDFSISHFGEYGIRIPKKPLVMRKHEQFAPFSDLWHKRHLPRYAAELQWRLSIPLTVFILTLIAVPLSRVETRQAKFIQLIPALLIFIVYSDLLFVARYWVQKQKISAALGLWWIHAIFLTLGLVLLCRFVGKVELKQLWVKLFRQKKLLRQELPI